ncbi:DUF262 domain-containing protein [Schinkia azotoformans]|uniref:DUF262 domain-containing protein n=1 Tax=Schinkia azotoformans TaxID=1454 RepID=UPI002DB72178|nr:DUF262 domain-containing protein [Schinkia azotoformans]MEC1698136.1 DUF262 domain-containing protein [Schinkia azotoformans]
MEADKNSILGFLSAQNRRFSIPVYQREYTWNLTHCGRLLNDIKTIMKYPNKRHFIGSVVQISNKHGLISQINEATIIDGQQRITTVSLILIALRDYIRENFEHIDETIAEEIEETYLVNSRKKNEDYIKLCLTKKDKILYDKLIYGTPLDETNSKSNIISNYRYFYKQIKSQKIDIKELYDGLAKLDIVEIALERDIDDPQLIFESLNSTGEKLVESDLIRNFLLMGLENDVQTHIYNEYWYPIEERLDSFGKNTLSNFIRDFLTIKNLKIPKESQVFTDFKSYFSKNYTRKKSSIEKFMTELDKFSRIYKKIVSADDLDNKINTHLKGLELLEVKVIYPFIMYIYDYYLEEKISKSDFSQILLLIESYLSRRIILEHGSQGLNKVFVTFIRDFNYKEPVKSFEIALLNKKGHHRFPNNEEFENAFLLRNIYTIKTNYKKYILYSLEKSLSNEVVDLSSQISIEHIMPQNIDNNIFWQNILGENWLEMHQKYLHTIGNLTLTAYNSNLSNKTFIEKKEMLVSGYDNSSFNLSKTLKKYTTWTENDILDRSKFLIKQALSIWQYPNSHSVHQNSNKTEITLEDSWTSIKPVSFEFLTEKTSVKTFIDVYLNVIQQLYLFDSDAFYQALNEEEILNVKFHSVGENEFDESKSAKIGEDIYINTNISNEAKRKNLQVLFDSMEIDENDLIIEIENPHIVTN